MNVCLVVVLSFGWHDPINYLSLCVCHTRHTIVKIPQVLYILRSRSVVGLRCVPL